MEEEIDVIQHLLEIEAEASEMLSGAQQKADAILAEARANAEAAFKKSYSAFMEELEAKEISQKEEIAKEHKERFETYTKALGANAKDEGAFNKLLDKLLYA